MSEIKPVRIPIISDEKDAVRGLKRTRRGLDDVRHGSNSMGASVGKMASMVKVGYLALAGAVTGAGFAISRTVRRNLGEIDQLAKSAAAMTVSIADLQALRLAGSLGGMNDGQIDRAVLTLNRRIGEFQAGLGEARVAFAALNLTAASFDGLSTARRLALVADRLANIRDSSQRAFLSGKIFGEELGPKLAVALAGGGRAIDDASDKLDSFGAKLSEKQGAAVEQFNDKVTVLKTGIGGLKQSFVADLAPAMSTAIDLFPALITGIREYVAELKTAEGMNRLASDLLPPVQATAALVDFVDRGSQGVVDIPAPKWQRAMLAIGQAAESATEMGRAAATRVKNMADRAANYGDAAGKLDRAIGITDAIDNARLIGNIVGIVAKSNNAQVEKAAAAKRENAMPIDRPPSFDNLGTIGQSIMSAVERLPMLIVEGAQEATVRAQGAVGKMAGNLAERVAAMVNVNRATPLALFGSVEAYRIANGMGQDAATETARNTANTVDVLRDMAAQLKPVGLK